MIRLTRWRRSPLFWILLAAAVFRLAGITWGLPAADGWDDDGIAPRNFLVGLVETYAPGSYFTYPPLHMILLVILTAPGWIVALFRAHSLAPHDVIAEMTQVPYMTFFAVVARLVGAAMSVTTIYIVGRMTETVAGRRAGICAAAACALNATLVYYGQVSNLDGPYLFWCVLSLWGWMRLIAEREPGHVRWAALAAAAAVATKDQAYAVFIVSVPAALVMWFALDRWPRRHARSVLSAIALWGGVALLALLLIDGAVTNPAGFSARLAFLTGHASRDYAEYQGDWTGRFGLLRDMWAHFPRTYPSVVALFGVLGIAVHAARWRERSRFVAGLLPILAAISFTLAFDFAALRDENRFLLPQTVLLAVYVGIAVESLVFASRRWIGYVGRGLVAVTAAVAFWRCAAIDAAFLGDPRYDTERWLEANLRPGDTIETYGLNAYLPRFPGRAIVTRLDDTRPLARRNPLPGVREVDQPYAAIAARRPRYIVVSGFWVADYLAGSMATGGTGRLVPEVSRAAFADGAARAYFRALFAGRSHYRLVHKSTYVPGVWPPAEGYESLTQTMFVFERVPSGR